MSILSRMVPPIWMPMLVINETMNAPKSFTERGLGSSTGSSSSTCSLTKWTLGTRWMRGSLVLQKLSSPIGSELNASGMSSGPAGAWPMSLRRLASALRRSRRLELSIVSRVFSDPFSLALSLMFTSSTSGTGSSSSDSG